MEIVKGVANVMESKFGASPKRPPLAVKTGTILSSPND